MSCESSEYCMWEEVVRSLRKRRGRRVRERGAKVKKEVKVKVIEQGPEQGGKRPGGRESAKEGAEDMTKDEADEADEYQLLNTPRPELQS